MAAFLSKYYPVLLIIVAALYFLVKNRISVFRSFREEEKSVETRAMVSKIVEDWDADMNMMYRTYVAYRDRNGELRESTMSYDPEPVFYVGEQVIIRYFQENSQEVRYIRTAE